MPRILCRYFLFCLLCGPPTGALAQLRVDRIQYFGVDTSAIHSYEDWTGYRSTIDYPPFLGWDKRGRKMLFNGGQVIYSMRSPTAEIREHLSFASNEAYDLSPDEQMAIYLKDTEGDENYQLFLYDLRTETTRAITKPGSRTTNPVWSPDGAYVAYKSSARDSSTTDLYIHNVRSPGRDSLVIRDISDEGLVHDWRAEAGRMLVTKIISENVKPLYLLNYADGTIDTIGGGGRPVAYSLARFIPGREQALIVSDEGSEFQQIYLLDLRSLECRKLTADLEWDVEELEVAADGRTALFTLNAGGYSELYRLDLTDYRYDRISTVPRGIIRGIALNKRGDKLGFNLHGSTFRRKVYSYDLTTGTLSQWARKGKLPSDHRNFIAAESIWYPSRDRESGARVTVPAFLYRSPHPGDRPVYIDVHGGPEYQSRPFFNSFYQYLTQELGISVVVPNVRGSSGYGKSYLRADDGFGREVAIQDIGALLDWVASESGLDAERVILTGESYGGYVVLASLAAYPDRIKAGIESVGISDFSTFLRGTAHYRTDLRRVEFGDEREPAMAAFHDEVSPLRSAGDITSPLLIFHGRRDPRVSLENSTRLFEAVVRNGQPVWMIIADDEGHGFTQYANHRLQINATLSFIHRFALD